MLERSEKKTKATHELFLKGEKGLVYMIKDNAIGWYAGYAWQSRLGADDTIKNMEGVAHFCNSFQTPETPLNVDVDLIWSMLVAMYQGYEEL